MREVAEEFGLPLKDVYSMVSFHPLLHMRPTGQYVIQVCENLACFLSGGGDHLVDYLRKKLGIELGETTPDGKFTLEAVQCLAACDGSPAMRINDKLYRSLTEERVDEVLEWLAGG